METVIESKSLLDIITNNETFYEKVQPYLFPDIRKHIYSHEFDKALGGGFYQNVFAVMIIGMPNEKNIRDFAEQICLLWKEKLVAGLGYIAMPTCKEISIDNDRRRFVMQTTLLSIFTQEEMLKKTSFAITGPEDLPQLIFTNPYSPEEATPDITPDQVIEHTKKTLEDYVKDPAVIEQARTVADEINKCIKGNNWFTLDQATKKTRWKDIQEVFNLMNILCLTGYAVRREFEKGVIKYKLTLSPEDRIALIKEQIQIHKDHIANLEKDIEREQAKIQSVPES